MQTESSSPQASPPCVWIDIDNAPQVQYLSPFARALEDRGCEVVLTARDDRLTLELLSLRGIAPLVIHGQRSASPAGKITSTSARALRLYKSLSDKGLALCISSSRSAMLGSVLLGVPSIAFCDYEFVELRSARITRSYIIHPDTIPSSVFLDAGVREHRLLPFPGIKEEISFSHVDFDTIQPLELDLPPRDQLYRVLVRPPGETTHYFVRQSRELMLEALGFLASRDDVVVLFSPRDERQLDYLNRFRWSQQPIAISHGEPFASLLKTVDCVVSSGGTMIREAAYLGIPAFSILRSRIGAVDSHLEATGRLTVIESRVDLPKVTARRQRLERLPSRVPDLVGDVADMMLTVAVPETVGSQRRSSRALSWKARKSPP